MKRACVLTFAFVTITVLALAPSAVAEGLAVARSVEGSGIPALDDLTSEPQPRPMTCTQVAANPQDDTATNWPSGPVDIHVLANDPSGVELLGVTQPSVGTATIVGPDTIRYSPPASFSGTVTFNYAVTGCLLCGANYCYEPDVGQATVTVDVVFIE